MAQPQSLDDVEASEIFRTQSRSGDRPAAFEFTSFLYRAPDADGTVYFGSLPVRKSALSLDLVRAHLAPIPADDIHPRAPPRLTASPLAADAPGVYVKRPRLAAYALFADRGSLAAMLLREAETLEALRARPHPHVARYHGALVRGGRVRGLVMARYRATLRARLDDDGLSPSSPCPAGSSCGGGGGGGKGARRPPFDGAGCMAALRSAVAHLHALGLAHNDINPANVMVDGADAPVLIDFGSCRPFGARLESSTGTPGWMEDEDFATSEASHDEFALGLMQRWVMERAGEGQGRTGDEGSAAR
jgi:serine/threonine protein kinase